MDTTNLSDRMQSALASDVAEMEGDEVPMEDISLPVDSSKETADKYKSKLKGILKQKADMFEDMVQHEEAVRLGDDGWKARYYEQKFGITDPAEQAELAQKLCHAYVEGLCWVMRYYFDGVASWTWYYPFHYAPFASDLVNLSDLQVWTYNSLSCSECIGVDSCSVLSCVLPHSTGHVSDKAALCHGHATVLF